MKRKIAAILAADVAGYSRLVAEDEEETIRRLAAYREVFDDFVQRYGGRIFNTAGDSVMCEFDSAVEATRAAIDIQESLRTRNMAFAPSRRLQFRIGITIGDVVERGGDLLGDGVNIAARLESLAAAGGICISRSVHEAVSGKVSVPFRDLGQREVKNLPQPLHAFVVEWPDTAPASLPAQSLAASPPPRQNRAWLWFLVTGGVAVLVAGIGVFLALKPPAPFVRPQATAPARPVPAPSRAAQTTPVGTTAAPKRQDESRPGEAPPAPAAAVASPNPSAADPSAAGPAAPNPSAPNPSAPNPTAPSATAANPTAANPTAANPTAASPAPSGQNAADHSAAEAYAALARQGGIVPEARTPAELYHNARLHEARGHPFLARNAYLALAAQGLELVDPHLRLSALLRVQDGRAGAREVYSELVRDHPARVVALMHARLFEGRERRSRVEAFVAANPDFAPAHYLLAEEYSEDRLGVQTLTDRRLEYDALERFLEAENDGRLTPYFLDQSVLAQWLDRARLRKLGIEAYFATASTRPTASFTRSNTGWTAALAMPEAATGIAYRIGEAGDFRSTGTSPSLDPRTGKPAPLPTFELPADQDKTTIYVRYDDASGRTAGPYPVSFDPRVALVASQRGILDTSPGAWVAFRADREALLYFTHLVSYRCAIDKVVIGFDEGPLDTTVPLPPCDPAHPHDIPSEVKPYLSLPRGVRSVSVQLTYADGSQSEVKTFKRQ